MKTLHHPAFADVAEEVTDEQVDAFVEAGWRKTPLRTASDEKSAKK